MLHAAVRGGYLFNSSRAIKIRFPAMYWKNVPQGPKATLIRFACGTSKLVPFQNSKSTKLFKRSILW
jgi:hypothetical protein